MRVTLVSLCIWLLPIKVLADTETAQKKSFEQYTTKDFRNDLLNRFEIKETSDPRIPIIQDFFYSERNCSIAYSVGLAALALFVLKTQNDDMMTKISGVILGLGTG